VREPESGQDWLGLTTEPLAVGVAHDWAVRPDCGAVALFSGTVRDHAEGREGVTSLVYEAYEEHVLARFERIAAETRRRWPEVGRIVLWHRLGQLALGESSVVVAVSAPHRAEAFEAARFGIDTLKATVPIWKKEQWGDDGAEEGWALAARSVSELADLAGPGERDR
jgi:molybdopterin synthase catalytic subunit